MNFLGMKLYKKYGNNNIIVIFINATLFVCLFSATRGELHNHCARVLSMCARLTAQTRKWTSCKVGVVVLFVFVCCIFCTCEGS